MLFPVVRENVPEDFFKLTQSSNWLSATGSEKSEKSSKFNGHFLMLDKVAYDGSQYSIEELRDKLDQRWFRATLIIGFVWPLFFFGT